MKKLLTCFTFFISLYSFSQSNTFAGVSLTPTSSTCITGTNQFIGHTIFSATNEITLSITGNNCSSLNTTVDSWYKFTTQSEFPVITVTPTGSSWTTTVPIKIQILAGTVLTSLIERGCGSSANSGVVIGTPVNVAPTTALTPGTDYYVRVSKGTTGNPGGPSANWNFNICFKEGTASRMGEVFKQTILSAANVLNYPWEIIYGPDNNLWITEARGYKVYKMDPTTGTKTTVLDLTSGSTWLTSNGAPAGSDSLAAINTSSWNGGWPSGSSTNPNWPQGGFAGMALHPKFLDGTGINDYAYVTYVHRYLYGGGTRTGVVFRNKLIRLTYNTTTQKFSSPVVLCDTLPGSNDHNSQRIIIAAVTPGGPKFLFYSNGDMGAGQFGNRDRPMKAQNPASYEGKILRFNLVSDGDAGGNAWIPNDNPYSATSAVYSIGIRNNQGLAYDTTLNILYGSSHGPYSDDEINIIQASKNYGHPSVIGYASDGNYNGTSTQPLNTSVTAGAPYTDNTGISTCMPIGNEATNAATIGSSYKDPLFSAYASTNATIKNSWSLNTGNANWESEAWSGLDLYSNKVIPGWKQSLVASGLKWGRMIKVKLDPTGTTLLPPVVIGTPYMDTVTYFQSINRYRDLAFAPNGKDIFLVMDNSSATSGPGVGNPTVPGCPGCVIKYSFLGYADSAGAGVSTIPKSIDVTKGTNNTCNTGTTVTIDATNNKLWVPITGSDGNIMAEIKANGNNLGVVTSSFYQKAPGAIRVKNGARYLDRNITITPTVQPGSNVDIRLYITKAEYDDLDADALSGIVTSADIKILKNGDACLSAVAAATTLVPTTTATHGASGYVLKGSISSFSSFYFGSNNITLPLNLLTFTGSLQRNNTALLKWETENEVNVSHFKVERSADGNSFIAIGEVRAQGSNNTTTQYSLVDNNIANLSSPVIYYRLKMMDIDGSFKYSSIVPISLADITGRITLAPNPVINEVKVSINAPADGKVQWRLIDNTGRVIMYNSLLVRKGTGNNFTIDMSKKANGSYYLSVEGPGLNQKVKLQKL